MRHPSAQRQLTIKGQEEDTMFREDSAGAEAASARQQLATLRRYSEEGAKLIPLKGSFNFTKASRLYVEGVLLRDFDLECSTSFWVSQRTSWETLLGRFAELEPCVGGLELARHYPTRVLAGNAALASSQDVFLYFPFGANVSSGDDRDVFGFELVETSERIFSDIHAPCMLKTFAPGTAAACHRLLFGRTSKLIYLYALLHETSHRIGPWKVVPAPDARIGVDGRRLAIMGELAADLTLVRAAKEFPELGLFVFLNRIFWYGRRGWTADPASALLNIDNDSWGAVWLWQKFEQYGALSFQQDRIDIDLKRLAQAYDHCFDDIASLGNRLIMTSGPSDALDEWMVRDVPKKDGLFHLPASLRRVYELCGEVPEVVATRSFGALDSTMLSLFC
jgi:hypothetical protein